MEEKKTEGLLLHSIPYLNGQKILKVLTPNAGLVSLIVKNKHLNPFTDPFSICEWVIKKRNSELYQLVDASFIHHLQELRGDFNTLLHAGYIAQDILKTQMAEKPSPKLYLLAISFLKKISQLSKKQNLVSSFRLKLLIHDGLLSIPPPQETSESFSLEADLDIQNLIREKSLVFSPQEWLWLYQLAHAKQFTIIENIDICETFHKKVQDLLLYLV